MQDLCYFVQEEAVGGGGVPDFPFPTFKAQAAHSAPKFLCSPSAAAVR